MHFINVIRTKNFLIYKSYDNFILLFILTVYPLLVIPNKLGYNTLPRYIVLVMVSLGGLYYLVKERIKLNYFAPVFISLSMFLLFLLISTILAPDKQTAWIGLFGVMGYIIPQNENKIAILEVSRFTGFSTYFFCIILFILAYRSKKSQMLMRYMIISATFVSLIGILQFFDINIVPHTSWQNWPGSYSTIGNPNFFSTYLVFILPASIFFYLEYGKRIWLFISGIIYSGLLVAMTRGGWLAFFVSVLFILSFYIRNIKIRERIIFLILSLLIVSCIFLPMKDWIIFKKALSIPYQVGQGISLNPDAGNSRMFIWKESLKLFPKNWAFGIGPDHLIYANIVTPLKEIADKAHNIFIEILITMGIFAFISYIVFLSYFLHPWKNAQGFLYFIMIFTYLVQGFFNIDVIMVMPLFWIVLGFSLRNIQESKNTVDIVENE